MTQSKSDELLSLLQRQLADCESDCHSLKRERDRSDLLTSSIRDYAVIAFTADRRIEAWNTGAEHMMGWRKQDALGQPASLIFPPEQIAGGAPAREFEKAAEEGRWEEEGWHVRRDGTQFWGSGVISPIWESPGQLQGFIKVMRDVTAQRAAEERLRENEERFRLFVANVADYALIQVDRQMRVSSWNTGAERIFGYQEQEILEQPMQILLAPGDGITGDAEQALERASNEGRSEYERWLVRKDGTHFWARSVITPMRDAQGKLRGYAKVLHDETARKEAENRLLAALHEKNALVQEVHHRVKNNLQVISSLLSVQADRVEDPRMLAILDDTQNRVRAIAAIHERFYASPDFASINFGPYMEQLVRGLFALYAVNQQRIELRLNAADVVLDVQQAIPLGLIVNELVMNVLKHAFPAGRSGFLEISLAYVEDTLGPAQETLDQGLARLAVADNGIGLPPGAELRQANSMGYHLVHLLVEQLHGQLKQEADSGTRVTITFPLTTFPLSPQPKIASSE